MKCSFEISNWKPPILIEDVDSQNRKKKVLIPFIIEVIFSPEKANSEVNNKEKIL